jgi:hypothetical protein
MEKSERAFAGKDSGAPAIAADMHIQNRYFMMGNISRSNDPLKCRHLLREGEHRQVLLRLHVEKIGNAADDEAVHHECDCKCREL